MAREIDQRVVEMQFDNHDFERNVQASLTTLDKLKMALNFDGAKGLNSLSQAANKVDLSNIEQSAEAVSVKFSAMQIAGMTAISNLTTSFMNFGKHLWDISFGQMKSGGMARALKIEQANFKMKALAKNMEGIGDSEERVAALMDKIGDSIDRAVTGTAYGYDAAANVASSLMASGLTDADKMYNHLRAIAGAAAMTGRSFEDIGHIFTTVASNGKLMTLQMRQFSFAGLNVAAELARQWGKSEAEINSMVTKGQISFEDFSKAMYDAFGDAAGKADETYSGVTTNIKAQLSRLGQLFAQPYTQNMIPMLQKFKAALQSLNKALTPVAKRFEYFMKVVSDIGTKMIASWNFQRLNQIFRGIENIMWGIASVVYTVHQAFLEVFPKPTLDQLQKGAYTFERFTEAILPTKQALNGIKVIIKTILTPVKLLVKVFKSFVSAMKPVVMNLLTFAYTILSVAEAFGEIITGMIQVIGEGSIFELTFTGISAILSTFIRILTVAVLLIKDLFTTLARSNVLQSIGKLLKASLDLIERVLVMGLIKLFAILEKIINFLDYNNITQKISGLGENFEFVIGMISSSLMSIIDGLRVFMQSDTILAKVLTMLKDFVDLVMTFFSGNDISEQLSKMSEHFQGLKDSIKKFVDEIRTAFAGMDTSKIMMIVFAGVLIFFTVALINFIRAATGLANTLTGTVKVFKDLTSTISSIRKIANSAKTFMYFAGSVMIIAGALVQLSKVPAKQIWSAAGAIALLSAIMIGFTLALTALAEKDWLFERQARTIESVAKFLLALSGSMLILVLAVKAIATINSDMKVLWSAVGAISALIVVLGGTVALISKFSPQMAAGGAAFIFMAIAINILVKTLKSISANDIQISIEQLGILAGAIIAFGATLFLASHAGFGTAAAIIAMALALKLILNAFTTIAAIPTETIEAGLSRLKDIFDKLLLPVIISVGIAARLSGGFVFSIGKLALLMLALVPLIAIMSSVIVSLGKVPAEQSKAGIKAFQKMMEAVQLIIFEVMAMQAMMYAVQSIPKFASQIVGLSGLIGVLITVGFVIQMMSISVGALAGIAKENPRGLDKATQVVMALTGVLAVVMVAVELCSQFTKEAKTGPIIAAISALSLLIASLIVLQFAEPTNVVAAGVAILAALAGLALLFGGMSLLNKETKKEKTKTSTKETILIILALTPLIASLGLFYKMVENEAGDWKKAALAGGMLIGSMAVLGAFIGVMSAVLKRINIATLGELKILMLTLVPVIVAMSLALGILGDLDNLWGAGAMALVFAGLSVFLLAVGKFVQMTSSSVYTGKGFDTTNLFNLLSYLVVIGSSVAILMSVVAGLKILSTIPTDVLNNAAGVMGAMMLGILAIILGLAALAHFTNTKKLIRAAASIALVAAAMIPMVKAFNRIDVSEGTFGTKVAVLAGGLVLMGVIAGLLAKHVPETKAAIEAAAAMVIMATSLIPVSAALNIINTDYLLEKAVILGAFVGEMGVIAGGLAALAKYAGGVSTILAIAGSFTIMSVGVMLIAAALNSLADVDGNNLIKVAEAMTLLIGVMFALAAVTSLIVGLLMKSGLGMIVVAAIAVAVGLILALAASIKILSDALNGFASIFMKVADMTGSEIDTMIQNGKKFIDGMLDTIIEEAPKIIKAAIAIFGLIFAAVLLVMAAYRMKMVASGLATALMFIIGFEAILPLLLDTFSKIVDDIYEWYNGEGQKTMDKLGTMLADVLSTAFLGGARGLMHKAVDAMFGSEDEKEAVKRNQDANLYPLEIAQEMYGFKANIGEKNRIKSQGEIYDPIAQALNLPQNLSEREQQINDYMYSVRSLLDTLNQMQNPDTYGKFTGEEMIEDLKAGVYTIDDIFSFAETAIDDVAEREKYLETVYAGLSGYLQEADDAILAFNEEQKQLHPTMDFSNVVLPSEDFEQRLQKYRTVVLPGLEEAYEDTVDVVVGGEKEVEDAAGAGGGGHNLNVLYAMPKNDPVKAGVLRRQSGIREAYEQTASVVKEGEEQVAEAAGNTAEENGENAADEALESIATETLSSEILAEVLANMNKVGAISGAEFLNGLEDVLPEGLKDIIGGLGIMNYLNGNSHSEDYTKFRQEATRRVDAHGTQYYETFYDEEGKRLYDSADAYAQAMEAAANKNETAGLQFFKSITGYEFDEDPAGALEDIMNAAGDAAGGLGEYGSAADAAAEATSRMQDAISSALDIFSEFNLETSMTAKDVLNNFMSQITGVSQWSAELQALAGRGFSQALLEDLAEAGPQNYEQVHALYTMAESQIGLFNQMYAQKLSLEKNTAQQIRASFDKGASIIADEANATGQEVAAALGTGMTENSATTQVSAMTEMERGIRDAGYDVVNGVIYTADGIPKGMADAITAGTPQVVAAMANMGYQSIEAFKNYMAIEEAIDVVDDFQTNLKSAVISSISLFDEVTEQEEISAEQMLKNMTEQVKSVGRWASNLKILAERGISEGLLAELQDLGPQGAAKVEAFVKMTDAQLQRANKLYASSVELPDYVTNKLTTAYANAGFQTTLGFTEGIDPSAAEAVMTALGTQSLDALKASLDIHSPSGKTEEAGMYSVMGLVLGITENLPMIEDAGEQMGAALASVITVPEGSLAEFVMSFFNGISTAILNGVESLWYSEGFVALRQTVIDILTSITDDLELTPTIRPIIDMSDVDQKAGLLDLLNGGIDISGSVTRANAAGTRGYTDTAILSELRNVTANQTKIFNEMGTMRSDITMLGNAISTMSINMDGSAVGRLVSSYVNANLGRQYAYDTRRTMN